MTTKGELIAVAQPSVKRLVRIGYTTVSSAAAFVCVMGVLQGEAELPVIAGVFMTIFGVLALTAGASVGQVSVYEHGLQREISGGRNLCMFLPWSGVREYSWYGGELRIAWNEDAFLLFQPGQSASCERLARVTAMTVRDAVARPGFYSVNCVFPRELMVPREHTNRVAALLHGRVTGQPS